MMSTLQLTLGVDESAVQSNDWVQMAKNESPFGPSPAVLEAICRGAARAHFYPEGSSEKLRRRLAERLELLPEQILVTAGATHFLDLIARALLKPGLTAVTSERSFIGYAEVTRAAGGRLIEAAMRDDTYDVTALLKAIKASTRLLFLANPNNPTGTLIDASAIGWLLDRVPSYVTVIIDEAYYEFAHHSSQKAGLEYSRSLAELRRRENVVVLRSFSKAYGLAGLRVGYGAGPAKLVAALAALRTSYSVSALAESAALAALEDEVSLRQTLDNNAPSICRLIEGLEAMGFRCAPTFANFIYFTVREAAAALAARLQSRGIVVKPLAAWGAPCAIRVTVGTAEQNERFLAALAHDLRSTDPSPKRLAAH